MTRYFNTGGPCRPELHYMLPPEQRLPGVRRLIDQQLYFVVHAPRQSGKTTAFLTLAQALNTEGRYAVLHASCESAQAAGDDVDRGVNAILRAMERRALLLEAELRPPPVEDFLAIGAESRLTSFLTQWTRRCPRPVVLFLDEIDAVLGTTLISVLRQLREGYTERPALFPGSVGLIGLRDVRDYKIRSSVRPEQATLGTSSPFNVKVESVTLRGFTFEEVAALYAQHTRETGQVFAPEAVAFAYELTRGQPWLVNALARQLVEVLAPDPTTVITHEHVDAAKEILILRRDTHLDSLIEYLRDAHLRGIIEAVLGGRFLPPETEADDLSLLHDLGLVISARQGLQITNPIYRQALAEALTPGFRRVPIQLTSAA